MYNETNVPKPEYRVRPVIRYSVTAYYHPYEALDGSHGSSGSSRLMCECDSEQYAEELCAALLASEKLQDATSIAR